MQLYALKETLPIFAKDAEKGETYICPECASFVRVRGGPLRQPHFDHVKTSKTCRQHQKSLEHLHVQLRLLEALSSEEAQIEAPFPKIGRIADVAWHTKKIVFEVQCSPIALAEVTSRIFDYQREGYAVIWILHDKQFNKTFLSAAERHLRGTPCYYTNCDKVGNGAVYDQFEVLKDYRRTFKGPALEVNPVKLSPIPNVTPPSELFPTLILERLATWKWFAKGDLLYRLLKEGNLSLSAKRMAEVEARYKREKAPAKRLPLASLLGKTYLFLLDKLLRNKSR